MSGWMLFLRRAGRVLIRDRTFAGAFILTLALASGALTAFFSVVYGVLLRPLPFAEPGELVYFQWVTDEGTVQASSATKVDFWQRHSRLLDGVTGYELKATGATLETGQGLPEYARSVGVGSAFLDVLGVLPRHGPGFAADAGEEGAGCTFLASHDLWRRTWDGDPAAVGASVRLDEEPCVLVGVLPEEFRFQPPADVFVPVPLSAGDANLYGMIGRRDESMNREQVQAEARVLFANFRDRHPDVSEEERGVALVPFREQLTGGVQKELWLLFAAGVLVFVIGVVNLSNLLITRAQLRSRSTAMQVALGAARRELVLQNALEVSLAALLATLLGWGLARLLVPMVLALEAGALPGVAAVQVSWAEALFAGLVSSLAILVVALVPVLRMTGGDIHRWLRPSSGSGAQQGPGLGSRRVGRTLVVAQLALSLAVLVGAFAVVQGLWRVGSVDRGFTTDGVWSFQVPLQGDRYDEPGAAARFARDLERRLGDERGVERAAVATSLPLETGLNVPVDSAGESLGTAVEYRAVGPGYFESLGIGTVAGRTFEASDRTGTTPVAVVNRRLASRLPADAAPLERTLSIARGMGPLADEPRRIVGVVENVRDVDLESEPTAVVYVPYDQVPEALAQVVRRSFPLAVLLRLESPGGSPPDVRRILGEIDSSLAVAHVRPLQKVVSASLDRERFYALLLSIFGGVGLLLTALGIYGVVGSQMGQRTTELAVRMAVGARRPQLLRLVLVESLRLAAWGILLGVPLAFGLAHFLRSAVYGAETLEVLGLVTISLLLVVVAVLASYLPARRILRLDPAHVLR